MLYTSKIRTFIIFDIFVQEIGGNERDIFWGNQIGKETSLAAKKTNFFQSINNNFLLFRNKKIHNFDILIFLMKTMLERKPVFNIS